MSPQRRNWTRRAQRGAGIVETMIGMLIGLLVILVIYSLVSAAESYRRTTTGASDAQITGLLSQFIVGRDLSNGGNGTMLSAPDLINCTKNEAGAANLQLKPVPVLVTDGGGPEVSDTFVATNSSSPRVLWPVDFTSDSTPGTDFEVQNPNGFTAPVPTVAAPYWVIVAANDGSGRCQMYSITSATAPDAQGRVTLKHAQSSTITYTAAASARLINLGPQALANRIQYESWNTSLGEPCGTTPGSLRPCQLTSRDVLDPNPALWPARNPIASNVVLMKIQFGVDLSPTADGTIDCWTAAIAASPSCGGRDFSPAGLQAFTLDQLNRIIAVRIAVVVRSDEPDMKDDTLLAANRPQMALFNCSVNTNAGCPGRIVLTAGNATQILQDHWRYRSYETIVPLRNSIYMGSM